MKLTGNQCRILQELADGSPPRGFSSRGLESLVKRGLVTTTQGNYRVNRRHGGSFEVYRLTPTGLEALREAAHAAHKSAVREAKSELNEALRKLEYAEVVAPPTLETVNGK